MSKETIDTQSREQWEKAKTFFMMTLSSPEEKSQAERYFGMIVSVARDGKVFTIYTNSDFAAEQIRDNYANRLKGAFVMADAPDIELEVKCDEHAKPKLIVPTLTASYTMGQGAKPSTFVSTLPLNEEYTYDTFVRGPSNSYAVSAAEGVVKSPAKTGYNPLFIHGGTGLGKTHLMQAIGNELRKRNPGMAICYLTTETFE